MEDADANARFYEKVMEKPTTATEAAVASVLAAKDKEKLGKRLGTAPGTALLGDKRVKKDEEEGEEEKQDAGPIMEGMVEVAAEKRAIERANRRKQAEANMKMAEDTSMQLGDAVQDAEEAFEAPPDESADLFEPFNLNEERDHGYFDAEGNYVEYKEEKHAGDAWLEGVKIDEKLAKKVQEMHNEPEPEALGEVGIAKIKRKIANILKDEETVLQALKRLGAKQSLTDAANKAQFDDLTEMASNLMANGEYEVYSDTKRVFEREAALYEPKDPPAASAGDDGMDMFGGDDSDDDEPAGPPTKKPKPDPETNKKETAAGTSGPEPGATAASSTVTASALAGPVIEDDEEEDTTDYSSWPISELRRFLQENGEDITKCLEKVDMVTKAKETARRLRMETVWDPAASGFAYDASTGYYVSSDSGLYFDYKTKGFFNTGDGKWYSYDSAKQTYIEWEVQPKT